MRLIDADKLRESWLENGENEYVYDTNSMLESIDEQPTAYDLDKVVEQLEELDIEDIYDYTEEKYFEYVALHEAIEIVKGGGNE